MKPWPVVLLLVRLLIPACSSAADPCCAAIAGQDVLEIEVLGLADCPNARAASVAVEQAVRDLGLAADVRLVDLEALPVGDARRSWPSPTILVGGRDLFGMTSPGGTTSACRWYRGGAPSRAEVSEALRGFARP